jgi:hypothetical protein
MVAVPQAELEKKRKEANKMKGIRKKNGNKIKGKNS